MQMQGLGWCMLLPLKRKKGFKGGHNIATVGATLGANGSHALKTPKSLVWMMNYML